MKGKGKPKWISFDIFNKKMAEVTSILEPNRKDLETWGSKLFQ